MKIIRINEFVYFSLGWGDVACQVNDVLGREIARLVVEPVTGSDINGAINRLAERLRIDPASIRPHQVIGFSKCFEE